MSEKANQDEVKDIFVARMPIFDKNSTVYGYQLCFRSGLQEYVPSEKDDHAAIKVVANSLTMGLNTLSGGKKAFINFNRQLLLTRVPAMFPKDRLVIEISDRVNTDTALLSTVHKFKEEGYPLVMGEFVFEPDYKSLLPYADLIRVDYIKSGARFKKAVKMGPSRNVYFLADNIETKAQYKEALDDGYQLFRGFFFQEAEVISSREIPGHKFNYLQIIKKVCEPILPIDEIEVILKRDMSLTYKLLRFINSASYGFKVTVRSVRHALTLLGKREVKKWLTIIALSGICSDKPMELLRASILRARFCELIGLSFEKSGATVGADVSGVSGVSGGIDDSDGPDHQESQDPTNFFLMGMFSIADVLLARTMADILEGLPLEEDVKKALLGENNTYKKVLDLVCAYEKAQWENVADFAQALNINEGKLASFYIEAVEWALVV